MKGYAVLTIPDGRKKKVIRHLLDDKFLRALFGKEKKQ